MYSKHVLLVILLSLTTSYQSLFSQQFLQIGNELSGNLVDERFGLIHELSDNGERLIVGLAYDPATESSGTITFEKNEDGEWNVLSVVSTSSNDGFLRGTEVDISDDGQRIVTVLDRQREDRSPIVTIYEWNQEDESFDLLGSTFIDDAQSQYGTGVALSGDGSTVVFGQSPALETGEFTLVYRWDNMQWIKENGLVFNEDSFRPTEYAISDNGWVVAGANTLFNTRGRIRVFEKIGNLWRQRGNDIIGDNTGDQLGSGGITLSRSGDTLLVASPFDRVSGGSTEGSVMAFVWTDSAWKPLGDTLTSPIAGASLGIDADLSEDGSVIIAGLENGSGGQLLGYSWQGTNWVQFDEPLTGLANDALGASVSASGDMQTISVASPGKDEPSVDAGRIQFFQIDGIISDLTERIQPLKASVQVSPNPARGQMQLEYKLFNEMPLQITLVSQTGQPVRTIDSFVNQMAGTHRRTVSLKGVPKGTYFIRFQSNDRILTKPVVIR